jgi:hypothetical protein
LKQKSETETTAIRISLPSIMVIRFWKAWLVHTCPLYILYTILHDPHEKGEKHMYPFFTMVTRHYESNVKFAKAEFAKAEFAISVFVCLPTLLPNLRHLAGFGVVRK